MAAGDTTVKIQFRYPNVSAGGFTSGGVPQNNKQMVAGIVDFEYATSGILVSGAKLGLETIDSIVFNVLSANNDTAGTAAAPWIPVWINSTQRLIITDDAGTEATNAQTGEVTFFAVGDSAKTADLL